MLSLSQDGLLREMLLSKYRLQIFDYVRFQILLVSKSIGFFGGGEHYSPPPYKTLGWGPVAPASYTRCGH
jgi:hypothetical protein